MRHADRPRQGSPRVGAVHVCERGGREHLGWQLSQSVDHAVLFQEAGVQVASVEGRFLEHAQQQIDVVAHAIQRDLL